MENIIGHSTFTVKILAIETSCDETAIAILECEGSPRNGGVHFNVLSNIVLSQVALHVEYGGVFPTLAKREHSRNLIPALKKALEQGCGIFNSQFSISNQIPNSKFQILNSILAREPDLLEQFLAYIPTIQKPPIDAIAITYGPGLEPALWVGVNFAKALALVWGIPIIPVNHMEGHFFSALFEKRGEKEFLISNFKFPILGLLISGGHTELVLSRDWLDYEIIGETRDDAAGEAFDKVARMLGLGYPGGPYIAEQARLWKSQTTNHKPQTISKFQIQNSKFRFPRPMIESKNYDFSFSGLKTAVFYSLKELAQTGDGVSVCESQRGFCVSPRVQSEIAHEFQEAVTDVLVSKTIRAAEKYGAHAIAVGGGVSANEALGDALGKKIHEVIPDTKPFIAPREFTGDNAVMIGAAAYINTTLSSQKISPEEIHAEGTLRLG